MNHDIEVTPESILKLYLFNYALSLITWTTVLIFDRILKRRISGKLYPLYKIVITAALGFWYGHQINLFENQFAEFLSLLFFYSTSFLRIQAMDEMFYDEEIYFPRYKEGGLYTIDYLRSLVWISFSIGLLIAIWSYLEPSDLMFINYIFNLDIPDVLDLIFIPIGGLMFTLMGLTYINDNWFLDKKRAKRNRP